MIYDPVEKRYTQIVRRALGTGQSEEQLEVMKNRLAVCRAKRLESTGRLNDIWTEMACDE